MQRLRVVALTAALSLTGQAPDELRVMRATPESPADPAAEITITFDRPVAGGLESAIDPDTVFSLSPEVQGRLEWRDPMTLRFVPAAPLEPERPYTVTIRAGLEAMDGSVLGRAYTYAFTVAAPRFLAGTPLGEDEAHYLPPNPTFRLLVSAPVDAAQLERSALIRTERACGATDIPLRVTDQHRLRDDDPRQFQWQGYRGPWPRDTARDLRRVIEIEPVEALPLDCGATLRIPRVISAATDSVMSWSIRTYGPLRMREVTCGHPTSCPVGPIVVRFTTPVRGADVVRNVRIVPGDVVYTLGDTASVRTDWVLSADLTPRTPYAATVNRALTDIFGQRIEGALTRATRTTGYASSISHEHGRLLVERDGLLTLPVQHVNVDSLEITTIAVPDSMEAAFLTRSWGWDDPWGALQARATRRTVPVRSVQDERRMTGVRLPVSSASGATLHAVRVSSPALDSLSRRRRPIALVQVTDLAVHARVGVLDAMVWVTGVGDGEPRPGARVTLYDARGRERASGTTDAEGIARLTDLRTFPDDPCAQWCELEGYVSATLAGDRALVGITSYDPDLSPWRFGVYAAWDQQRVPQSTALFTERGIYRPGEEVIAKAIVRDGPLGNLRAPAGDSLRWLFHDRDRGVARDTVVRLSAFGTDHQRFPIPAGAPLGSWHIELQRVKNGQWQGVAWTGYRVAEYRPPEFLVDITADPKPRFAGDTAVATVGARYLFGAPMAGAPVRWTVIERALSPWEIRIPEHEGWRVGVQPAWWEYEPSSQTQRASGVDTLDATGHVDLRVPLEAPAGGRGATVTTQAMVTDANRQVVTASASVRVHPAAFYLAARVAGTRWVWTAGEPVTIDVVAVTPEGERVPEVDVHGTIVRNEWHRVRRVRGSQVEEVGSWVQDTVARCALTTAADERQCTFTPDRGGSYDVTFTATDTQGRVATTSFPRWTAGPGWVPWNDENQLKMDIVADREQYAPGDTATLLFASPFTDAEAWITIERETVIESRRIRVEDGATTLRLPITEAYAPNVFVSMVVVQGRTAEPGPLDDPGRPAMRVGYTELRVLPDVKRLEVAVEPVAPAGSGGDGGDPIEYAPGDSARINLRVTDRDGRGLRAEVTLWAVDVGVLALTGYRTPDPLELLYSPRGLGMRLASNLVRVAPQIPDGLKGNREPGGGGGGDDAGTLRSRFQTTAFFLGSVVTDEVGAAVATAKLPDNLTTFRVMAVAVTESDRFGSGDAEILVTRPLVARPALPRFLREGDRFAAGVVVNQRIGGTPRVDVRAEAENIRLEGDRRRRERLEAGRGREFRFDFFGRRDDAAPLDPVAPDSAWFRFDASSEDEGDAVRIGIPYRVAWHPLHGTVAGMLRDTATVDIALQSDVDGERSSLHVSVGTSPLGFIDGARRELRVYPYYCTEQVSSVALPALAMLRANAATGRDTAELARTAREAVAILLRRQTVEGGIGYWSALDWTTPWLSAWAGRILLEARDAGIAVDSAALGRLASYVQDRLVADEHGQVPVAWWYRSETALLSERTAAADFLSRFGRPDVAAENLLLANAARLRWEDRLVLAGMLARRRQMGPAGTLLDAAWRDVRIDGTEATLPEAAYQQHYFQSRARPAARLLSATLAIRPQHEHIGALVEALVHKGRAGAGHWWNTQDFGWSVLALAEYHRAIGAAPPADIRIRSGRRTLLAGRVESTSTRDTTLSLDGLIRSGDDARSVRLELSGSGGTPVYWFATVREVPTDLQTTQIDRGITIERWYESTDESRPIVEVDEGELVRVRLRITVPAERHFVVLDDPLPAGLEAVDLSLRTLSGTSAFAGSDALRQQQWDAGWYYGTWDAGWWSPFDHKELRDDRVVYSASVLWPGSYTATYLARATTPGTFVAPPAYAEEMYNPGVNGRTAATRFTVRTTAR